MSIVYMVGVHAHGESRDFHPAVIIDVAEISTMCGSFDEQQWPMRSALVRVCDAHTTPRGVCFAVIAHALGHELVVVIVIVLSLV